MSHIESRCDYLIGLGLAGKLSSKEQVGIAEELKSYRDIALKMEAVIHKWSKIFDEIGIKP